jgi:hypothetical protein
MVWDYCYIHAHTPGFQPALQSSAEHSSGRLSDPVTCRPVAARNGFLHNEGLLSVSCLSVCPHNSYFHFWISLCPTELLSPYSDVALPLLLIVMTRMSTYINPMSYVVFFSLIINVLSLLSLRFALESHRPDFIWTFLTCRLYSIGPDSCAHPLPHFCGVSVRSQPTGRTSIRPVILSKPVIRTTGWHPVIRPRLGN